MIIKSSYLLAFLHRRLYSFHRKQGLMKEDTVLDPMNAHRVLFCQESPPEYRLACGEHVNVFYAVISIPAERFGFQSKVEYFLNE